MTELNHIEPTSRRPPSRPTDRGTGEGHSHPGGTDHADYTDLDTQVSGRGGPFEDYESDNTALVHVLWSLKHRGLIAGRPGRDEPLRRALFDRIFGEAKYPYVDGLIDDLRAILDAHDPRLHAGDPTVVGAARLSREQVDALPPEQSPRMGGDAFALAATVIRHSRWNAAQTAAAVERAGRSD